MGIQNLLQSLKPLTTPTTITSFSQKTIAVDVSSWIHKGAYACAERLSDPGGEDLCSGSYSGYVVRRCEKLIQYGGISGIILVFDGSRCPLKAETNKGRRETREANLAEARRLRAAGRRKEAEDAFRKCAKSTPRMARHVAAAVASRFGTSPESKVRCVWSPYEADPQLVKLCLDGFAHAIVSEDSDILVYVAACNKPIPVLFKLNPDDGSCCEVNMDWLLLRAPRNSLYEQALAGVKGSFAGSLRFMARMEKQQGIGRRMFVQACLLSGCDYVPSQKGVGIVSAFKGVVNEANRGGEERLRYVVRGFLGAAAAREKGEKLSDEGDDYFARVLREPEEYAELCKKAELVFFHHRVYDVKTREVEPLQGLSFGGDVALPDASVFGATEDEVEFIGKKMNSEELKALGNCGKSASPFSIAVKTASSTPSVSGWLKKSVSKPNFSNNTKNDFTSSFTLDEASAKPQSKPKPPQRIFASTKAAHREPSVSASSINLDIFAFAKKPSRKPANAIKRIKSPARADKCEIFEVDDDADSIPEVLVIAKEEVKEKSSRISSKFFGYSSKAQPTVKPREKDLDQVDEDEVDDATVFAKEPPKIAFTGTLPFNNVSKKRKALQPRDQNIKEDDRGEREKKKVKSSNPFFSFGMGRFMEKSNIFKSSSTASKSGRGGKTNLERSLERFNFVPVPKTKAKLD